MWRGQAVALRAAAWLMLALPAAAASLADETAPSLALPELSSGQPFTLDQYRGKVVYVDFWASWCGPCRQSLPLYEQLRRSLPTETFAIVAVNLDEFRDDAIDFLQQHPVGYTVLTDPSGESAGRWQIRAMPSSFLLDPQGRVVRSWAGFEVSHLEDIEHEIRKILP